MIEPEQRYLEALPYPVAYPYGLVFDEHERPSIRRWALCFTQYQALRMVCLPLVGQYLREPIDATSQKSITALNQGIAAIRSPFFSDWIALAGTLARHLPKAEIEPLFPGLPEALKSLGEPEERPVPLHGRTRLNPLEAILALRNATAHGGLVDEAEAARHLAHYLPVLHQVLHAFDFLADAELLVGQNGPEALATGRASLLKLRGARLGAPVEEDLTDTLLEALGKSRAVLRMPGGAVVPLYPLLAPVAEQEPLYLYDGHYGIRVETEQAVRERSYVYYLGTHHRAEDTAACERLKDLLARRHISFFLSKAQTAPWTLADSAADYSRRTLEDLIGQKYFPACYVPFSDLERPFERFLRVPDPERWPATGRARYVNGLVLVGFAGAGKTAFLARQVERLTAQDATGAQREGRNLVLFLRGNGIALRPEGVSLFRDLAEKLGVGVTPAATRDRPKASASAGFSSIAELFAHLHGLWRQDRVEGRRLLLVLDALNEAPFAEKVIAEALEIIDVAAGYPWCKVVISTRQEWLSLWSSKLGAQESSRLEELRPWLYVIETERDQRSSQLQGPPVVMLEPLAEAQAAEVYGRYQAAAGDSAAKGRPAIPASTTPWDDLPGATRALLANPLNLHLFMEAFDGRPAESVTAVPALYRRYVDRAMAERPGLEGSIEAVVAHLLEDLGRPSADLTDDDCNLLRHRWAESRSAEEARLELSPVEAIAHEGFITKRVREEGGGYRFLFQAVAEYLIYRYLSRTRSADEDELAYWMRRGQPNTVFPEYSGAFGFLLWDWSAVGTLALISQLVEASADWMQKLLTSFLVEQSCSDYVPGRGSAAARKVALALGNTGGPAVAGSLAQASADLLSTPRILAAENFIEVCVSIREKHWIKGHEAADIGDSLARELAHLGKVKLLSGKSHAGEAACRKAVRICDALSRRRTGHLSEARATALSNLGTALIARGSTFLAFKSLYRALATYEALLESNFKALEFRIGMSTTLSNLSITVARCGLAPLARSFLRRAIHVMEELRGTTIENPSFDWQLSLLHSNFGFMLAASRKYDQADAAYRRSEELATPIVDAEGSTFLAKILCYTLNNHGIALTKVSKFREAEAAYHRAVRIVEHLSEHAPDIPTHEIYALSLMNLTMLWARTGQVSKAKLASIRAFALLDSVITSNSSHSKRLKVLRFNYRMTFLFRLFIAQMHTSIRKLFRSV